jgi:hypothetical protein
MGAFVASVPPGLALHGEHAVSSWQQESNQDQELRKKVLYALVLVDFRPLLARKRT